MLVLVPLQNFMEAATVAGTDLHITEMLLALSNAKSVNHLRRLACLNRDQMVDAVFHRMVSETSTALPPPLWRQYGKRRKTTRTKRRTKMKNKHDTSRYITRRVTPFTEIVCPNHKGYASNTPLE